jgi:2-dehydro-3-deoxygluconokinase
MRAAKARGTVVSYDLNYRQSLWQSFGVGKRAPEANCELVSHVDALFGNEEDFTAALGNLAIDQGQRIWFRDHVGPQGGA